MNKRNFLLGGAALVMLATSCVSEDKIIDELGANNEIKFNVTNEHVTRTNHYATAADINNFKVSAVLQGSGAYFTNESISREVGGPWKYDSGTTRYWPSKDKMLNFFAVAPTSDFEVTLNGQIASLENVDQKNISEMNDMIVANAFDQEVGESTESKKVDLNFTHALAQVAIAAKVPSTLKVEVEEVAIVNINSSGKYSYPTSSGGSASWTKVGTGSTLVSSTMNKTVAYKDENSYLALVPTSNAFLILPFEYPLAENKDGSCIRIKCKMYNVVNGEDRPIFEDNNGNAKYLYIPVAMNFKMGKRYNYNLSFGTGTAGFDEEGNTSLVKIDWNVNLDDWEGDGDAGNDGNDDNDNSDDWIQINPGEQTV